MKPKTEYQKKVVELNRKVNPLPNEVTEWAKENALSHPAIRKKNNVIHCLRCGNQTVYTTKDTHAMCLGCGRKVRIIDIDSWKAMSGTLKGWFSTVSVMEGIQLQRTFEIRGRFYDRKPHLYKVRELCRHWLSPLLEIEVTALPRLMGQFLDTFPWNGNIELRGSSRMVYDYITNNSEVYPNMDLLDSVVDSLTLDEAKLSGALPAIKKSLKFLLKG